MELEAEGSSPSGSPNPEESWSVALSGGGHRATLFTLAALIYLCDAGLNHQVARIASVSGGSINNGVTAATNHDFASVSPQAFRQSMQPLIRRCALRGTVQWRPSAL